MLQSLGDDDLRFLLSFNFYKVSPHIDKHTLYHFKYRSSAGRSFI